MAPRASCERAAPWAPALGLGLLLVLASCTSAQTTNRPPNPSSPPPSPVNFDLDTNRNVVLTNSDTWMGIYAAHQPEVYTYGFRMYADWSTLDETVFQQFVADTRSALAIAFWVADDLVNSPDATIYIRDAYEVFAADAPGLPADWTLGNGVVTVIEFDATAAPNFTYVPGVTQSTLPNPLLYWQLMCESPTGIFDSARPCLSTTFFTNTQTWYQAKYFDGCTETVVGGITFPAKCLVTIVVGPQAKVAEAVEVVQIAWRSPGDRLGGDRLEIAWRSPPQAKVEIAATPRFRVYPTVTRQNPHVPTWEELHYASQLARWSGLCYEPEKELENAVHDAGLRLVASGRDKYTSWIVADGVVDAASFAEAASVSSFSSLGSADFPDGPLHVGSGGGSASAESASTSASGDGAAAGGGHGAGAHRLRPWDASRGDVQAAVHAAATAAAAAVPAPSTAGSAAAAAAPTRFVLLRGVHWGAPETSSFDMAAALAQFWPVPFARAMTQTAPGSEAGAHLVSHSGVADIALELFATIAPHLRGMPAGQPLVFAGHSLGGALAKLLWALSLMHGHRPPALLRCDSFGSPPVLAHSSGGGRGGSGGAGAGGPGTGGSAAALRLLNAAPRSARNWVLEHDPIPRSLTLADPYLSMAMQNSAVRGLLQVRAWLTGSGSIDGPSRFLFENVGEVYLIKGGCEVVPVLPCNEASEMAMVFGDTLSRPHKTVQYWLDHHHASYSHDLYVAAVAKMRAERRAQARREGAGAAVARGAR
ncbi:hypothetical protein FOA52_006612 [Chlamydomonas sp. UWO 241]|nr:hypothetical protein FOA52_006612 [Chlamydomonas sp. UWO 241]